MQVVVVLMCGLVINKVPPFAKKEVAYVKSIKGVPAATLLRGPDLQPLECRGRHIPQSRPQFALRTGDEITYLVVIERPRRTKLDARSVRNFQQTL